MKTFLVTGVTGFLGSALAERLLNEGYRVIGIARQERGLLSDAVVQSEYFTFIKADLSKELPLQSDYYIDGMFHLAAQMPSVAHPSYKDFYDGNVETTLRLLEFARVCTPKFFVHSSTMSVFGAPPTARNLNETSIPTPTSYYGLTKYLAERLTEIMLRDTSTKAVVMRFPILFGKNYDSGMIYSYLQSAKEGKDIEVYGRGERYRSLLYVDDAVDALVRISGVADKLGQFEIVPLGSQSMTMRNIAERIKELTHSSSKIVLIDRVSPTDWDVFVDNARAQELLRFLSMTIDEGLKKYVEEMKV